nr:fimbria/pilus outer membrane usher protein [Luteibacter sp. dw_328]
MPDACANEVEFDVGMLKLRGIDPKLADYFREAPRFTAGSHEVSLRVNGQSLGRVSVRFDDHGGLCVDPGLLEAAAIVSPRTHDPLTKSSKAQPCLSLASMFPTAHAELDPAGGEVSLLVPTHALRERRQDMSGYARGGTAALFNYDLTGLESRWGSRRSRYASANTETGFNAGDWVVRSRQVSTSIDGRHRTEVLDTYAQRSFAEHGAVLQFGEINVVNPALPGAQITGVQVMSEQALATPGAGAVVEGVAQSQGRIEIRQDGVLVYSTVVPAGPFVLRDIPRINRRADLDVTVAGAGGESQHFVVPMSMAGAIAPSTGYSFALGRTRNTGGTEAPWMVSAGWSATARRRLKVSGGATLASNYQAIGAGVGSGSASGSQVQLDITGARASREGVTGMQALLTWSQRLGEAWSVALSHSRQGPGFREFLGSSLRVAAGARRTRYRDQTSLSLSWSRQGLGNLSAGYSRTGLFDGQTTSRALASWGTRIGRASVSLSAEWTLSHERRTGNKSFYLNVNVPLGDSHRLASTVRRYAGETRYGASFSGQMSEFASYSTGLEYRSGDHQRSESAAVSLLPRYFQLDAGYAHDTRSRTTSLGLRGGLVVHDRGVTASPYAVRETFGVLSVGDTAGIRVSTPGGPVWTDARGYAVLPQLSAYGNSSIEVATDSLPRDMDIDHGASVISAGRGTVAKLAFGVSRTRRVLVRAQTVDGQLLPFGATVTDETGEVVGMVQREGEIFVPNVMATPRLWVSGPDTPPCELDIDIDDHVDRDTYYESASAVCRVSGEAVR